LEQAQTKEEAMKRHTYKLSLALLVMLAGGIAPALSQDKSDEPDSAESQVAELHKPGPEHKWLAEDKGEWTLEAKSWSPFGTETTEYSGHARVTVLWDRFVREEFTLGEGDQSVRGEGYIGYDNAARLFRSTYILSYGTGMATFTGKRSEDGTTVEFINQEANAEMGTIQVRSVYKRTGNESRTKEIFVKFGDQPERQVWLISYARKK
jgi:hypothetical protein